MEKTAELKSRLLAARDKMHGDGSEGPRCGTQGNGRVGGTV